MRNIYKLFIIALLMLVCVPVVAEDEIDVTRVCEIYTVPEECEKVVSNNNKKCKWNDGFVDSQFGLGAGCYESDVVVEAVDDTDDEDLYKNISSATVDCSSLGLLRKDLNGIFSLFKIIAPILVIVMSAYDFIRAIAGKVEGDIKKAFMKFVKRLVFAMLLFFLPMILDFFLGLVDSGYSTCINS